MSIQQERQAHAEQVLASFGEVIHCNGLPIDAIVEHKVLDLDEYGTVKGTFTTITVMEATAAPWNESTLFSITSNGLEKIFRLVDPEPEDSNGLAHFKLLEM